MKKATWNGRGGPAPALSGVEGCPPVRRADTQVGPYRRRTIINAKWAALVVALLAVRFAHAGEPAKWQAEWQRVLEGAKKEGQSSLYLVQEILHSNIIAGRRTRMRFDDDMLTAFSIPG